MRPWAAVLAALLAAGCSAPRAEWPTPADGGTEESPPVPRSAACGAPDLPAQGTVTAEAAVATVRAALVGNGTDFGRWFANASASTQPVLLDGNGTLTPPGAPCDEPTSAGWTGDGRIHLAWQVVLVPRENSFLVGYGWVDTTDGALLHHLTAL